MRGRWKKQWKRIHAATHEWGRAEDGYGVDLWHNGAKPLSGKSARHLLGNAKRCESRFGIVWYWDQPRFNKGAKYNLEVDFSEEDIDGNPKMYVRRAWQPAPCVWEEAAERKDERPAENGCNASTGPLQLRDGLEFEWGDGPHGYCGDGGYSRVKIVDKTTHATVWQGVTCTCGRGCGGRDCVRDDWGYHDTDIEEFRAN